MQERLYKPWSIRPTPIMSCLLLELVCLFGYLSITAAYSCHLGGLAGTFRTAFYSYLSDLGKTHKTGRGDRTGIFTRVPRKGLLRSTLALLVR